MLGKCLVLAVAMSGVAGAEVRVAAAPAAEVMSKRFQVSVGGESAPVYVAKVLAIGTVAAPGVKEEQVPGEAAFASFDLKGSVEVRVIYFEAIKSVKVLPTSRGVMAKISGNVVVFTVGHADQLTVEVNGDWNNSLHLFVNEFEVAPDLKDPNLIYFGPGVHVITPMVVGSGKTIYIAAGAVVYGKLDGDKPHQALFQLKGENITVRGRGIIDGSLLPWHQASLICPEEATKVRIEGVTIRDSGSFAIPIRMSDHVLVDNVKLMGWRLNGDGIDVINSQDVEVRDSFVRVFDDLVVVKASTTRAQGGQDSRNILVKHMVLWNEIAHALSLGAELRMNAENVVFRDCDVIHDKGREWSLRVFNTDSGLAKGIVFEDIRMEEDRRPFSLWIGKDMWSRDEERGHIEGVVFRKISAPAPTRMEQAIDLVGFDAQHAIAGVVFEDVVIGGKALKASDVEKNAFVDGVVVKP